MMEDPPLAPAEPKLTPPAVPERDPFWSYSDVVIFACMAIPCMLLSFGMVRGVMWLFRLHPTLRTWELLPEQFLLYLLLTGVLAAIFHFQYGRPVWTSLGWAPHRLPAFWAAIAGVATAIAVSLVGTLIRVPNTANPMTELLKDRTSMILIAIFGVTIGPLFEELAFRGFLQPKLVRTLGVAPGILVANVPFGLLHFQQYGNSWRHVVVITMAGAAFGWMRHVTGSTRASTIMHAAYNGLFFYALFTQKAAGH